MDSFFGAFGIMSLIIPILAAVIFIGIILSILRSVFQSISDSASPITEIHCRVVTKRTNVSGSESSFTFYYATFEDDGGNRYEFSIKGMEYGMIAEGDTGILRSQGSRFLGFTRQIEQVMR